MFSLLAFIFITTAFNSISAHEDPLPSCKEGEYYYPYNNSCIDRQTKGARPFCKNATTLNSNVTCYPFTPTFMRCRRWVIDWDEVEIHAETNSLFAKSGNRKYEFGEYEIRNTDDGKDVIVCINETSVGNQINPLYFYVPSWVISIVSLIIAFGLCVAVPGFTTYRVVLPCYVVSLLAAYVILVTRVVGPTPSTSICYTYGVSLQFSFLAAFFWLNVIAFDLWRNVSVPISSPGKLRLIAYLTYGWGCPLIFVGTAVAFDQSSYLGFTAPFQPRFGQDCWFRNTSARLAFFYGPISAILCLNFVFFVLTLFVVRSSTVGKGVEKNLSLWRLSIELAVVMGLCWALEVVSWAVGGDPRYWYFTDILNGLQGLFILIVIAVRPNVRAWINGHLKKGRNHDSDDSQISYIGY